MHPLLALFALLALTVAVTATTYSSLPLQTSDAGYVSVGNYGHNQDFGWRTFSPPGRYVWATFTRFSLETNYDFVRLYSGNATLGTYSGTSSSASAYPELNTPFCLDLGSTSTDFTVRFTSDQSIASTGFALSYTFSDSCSCSSDSLAACNAEAAASHSDLASYILADGSIAGGLAYPVSGTYADSLDLSWTLPESVQDYLDSSDLTFAHVQISYDVEASYDYITFSIGETSEVWSGNSSASYCMELDDDNRDVEFSFHSDSSIHNSGFQLSYYINTSPCDTSEESDYISHSEDLVELFEYLIGYVPTVVFFVVICCLCAHGKRRRARRQTRALPAKAVPVLAPPAPVQMQPIAVAPTPMYVPVATAPQFVYGQMPMQQGAQPSPYQAPAPGVYMYPPQPTSNPYGYPSIYSSPPRPVRPSGFPLAHTGLTGHSDPGFRNFG
eukprot:gnl/Ergobibamus_cyprinoides/155.p1 GENE.gnl/Ergobibamus_cyprinoides/155~~gnl/Ergobibamus_cyprinoides/155.p1  ORF type:complete len:442 (+),score=106.84 gnl/Ergobibamus_cyprinoides/155:3-1328(+)